MGNLQGRWEVYIAGIHILTKEIKGKEGKNYFPWGSEAVLLDFEVKGMELHYKYLPIKDILEEESEHALKGTMYIKNKKWFDFIMLRTS